MNSEKKKEIKEYLEQSACMYGNMQKQALTLISELEGENKIFLKSKIMWKCLHTELCKENKQLKERTAELEKHIERVESERIRIKQDRDKKDELASKFIDSYNDSLKQFAERLKDKIVNTPHILGGERTIIDETLKEFINGRD